MNLEFQTVESLWREFWRSQDVNNGDECEEEKYLSKYVHLFQYYVHKRYIIIKCSCSSPKYYTVHVSVLRLLSKGDFSR